jgi:hypothetical protein
LLRFCVALPLFCSRLCFALAFALLSPFALLFLRYCFTDFAFFLIYHHHYLAYINLITASLQQGLVFIALSLACDGITGGVQNRLKKRSTELGVKPKPYDFMFWTNLFMTVTAAAIALFYGELVSGFTFCVDNPVILEKIFKFAMVSAVGQSFIFFTISTFDPLVCTTVTTTRKVDLNFLKWLLVFYFCSRFAVALRFRFAFACVPLSIRLALVFALPFRSL